MHRTSRLPMTTISLAAALTVAVAGQAQISAGATPEYRADVTPVAVAAGTEETFTVTLTHLDSTSREMGSVRITPPTGIDLTSATAKRGSNVLSVAVTSGSVTVGNLQLNDDHETATVTLGADVPCGVAGARTWTVEAIKNQSFDAGGTTLIQDPASELTTQVERCTLEFATQPKAAAANTVITSVAADPSGTPIRVQLRDGNGNAASQAGVEVSLAISSGTGTAGATLGGDFTDATSSSGVAAFSPTIDRAGRDYRLVASATISGITASDDSAAFDISDVAVDCSGACSGSSDKGDTSAIVSAETNGILTFSLGLDGLDCNNSANRFYASSSEVVTFDVTAGVGRTTVIITLAASSVTKVAKKYEVCFSSPASSFTNAYGVAIAAGQAGLLPACPKKLTGPCVVSKKNARNGDVLVTFSVPTGDPRGKI